MKTDNEILADFVGKRMEKPAKGYDQQWEFYWCDGYWPTLKKMKFHTSWDWIMAVVNKISQNNDYQDFVDYKNKGVKEIGSEYFGLDSITMFADINMVYPRCVDYAKWYMTIKNKNATP